MNPTAKEKRDIDRGHRAAAVALEKNLRLILKGAYLFIPSKWPEKSAELFTTPAGPSTRQIMNYPHNSIVTALLESGYLCAMTATGKPGSSIPGFVELGFPERAGSYYTAKPEELRPNRREALKELERLLHPSDTDARKWARGFVKTCQALPLIPSDEATMTTWFATAIMAGHDEAKRQAPPAVSTITQSEANHLESRNPDIAFSVVEPLELHIKLPTRRGQAQPETITAARIED